MMNETLLETTPRSGWVFILFTQKAVLVDFVGCCHAFGGAIYSR